LSREGHLTLLTPCKLNAYSLYPDNTWPVDSGGATAAL
jgi:hypothetical protein